MNFTTNFEEWLNLNSPKTDIEFLSLYYAMTKGGVFDKYEVTTKSGQQFITVDNTGLSLKLASSKAVFIFYKILSERLGVDSFEEWCKVSPKIFNEFDNAEVILDEVKSYGLAGISGGRLAVRSLTLKIQEIADKKGLEDIVSLSTYNHPYTELAFPCDINRHTTQEAERLVIRKFDELNPD